MRSSRYSVLSKTALILKDKGKKPDDLEMVDAIIETYS